MKKLIMILLAMAMMLGMVACGGGDSGDEGSGKEVVDLGAKYGIDMEAEGQQNLSDERVAMEILKETRDVWLERKINFTLDEVPKTYDDFVEHIGCDASYYKYNAKNGQRTFTWECDSDPTAKLVAIFWDKGDGYVLYAASCQNVR